MFHGNTQEITIQPIFIIQELTVPYLTKDVIDIIHNTIFNSIKNEGEKSPFYPFKNFKPVYALNAWSLLSLKLDQEELYKREASSSKVKCENLHHDLSKSETVHKDEDKDVTRGMTKDMARDMMKDTSEIVSETSCSLETSTSQCTVGLSQFLNIPARDNVVFITTPNTKTTNSCVLHAESLDGVKKVMYSDLRNIVSKLWKVSYIVGDVQSGNLKKNINRIRLSPKSDQLQDFEVPMLIHDAQLASTYKPLMTWMDQVRQRKPVHSATDIDAQNLHEYRAVAISEKIDLTNEKFDELFDNETLLIMPRLNHLDHPLEIIEIIKKRQVHWIGSEYPFHQARFGIALTFPVRPTEIQKPYKLNLHNVDRFSTDFTPIDSSCPCLACKQYTRAYICHLLQAHEMTGFVLLTIHNVYHYYEFFSEINRARYSHDQLDALSNLFKQSQSYAGQ